MSDDFDMDRLRGYAPEAVILIVDTEGRHLAWELIDGVMAPFAKVSVPDELPIKVDGVEVARWLRVGEPVIDGNIVTVTVDMGRKRAKSTEETTNG